MTHPKVTRRSVVGSFAGALAGAAVIRTHQATAQTPAPRARQQWDVAVIGAGVFGAWSAWTLRRQGKKVLLVDAWGPSHARASSGGESRAIRTEYRGDELYMRFAFESLAQWMALSRKTQLPIFHPIGALFLYQKEPGTLASSHELNEKLGVPMQRLERAELSKRYPQISLDGIAFGVLQPTMGSLMARRGVQVDPDVGDRIVSAEGLKQVRAYLLRRFPGMAKCPLAESRVCQYENTDNGDFIIDEHPSWENVLIVGGGSGHGFKHGPAVGRYVADLAAGKLSKPEARFALSAHKFHAKM